MKQQLLISVLFCTIILSSKADWEEATKDGLVKIPLSNPDGYAWFASLNMGTPL